MTLFPIHIESRPGGFRLSVRIESERGPQGELWFEIEGEDQPPRSEMAVAAVVAASLPVAGWIGENLVAQEACEVGCLRASQRYAKGFARLHGRTAVAVDAPCASLELPPNRIQATSFSGGVDSFYTLFGQRQVLGALVTGLGFDTRPDDDVRNEKLRVWSREVADEVGLRSIFVRTNFRTLFDPHAPWTEATHGALLAAFAYLLSEAVEVYFVPASASIDQLVPSGSHALLDQVWAHTPTRVVNDGWEAHRNEKLRAIGNHDLVRRTLRVCSRPAEGRNCGRCFKCVKTMVAMAVYGVRGVETFPHSLTARQVRRLHITSWRDVRRFETLRREAKADPESAWLASPLGFAILRARWRLLRRATGRLLRVPPIKRILSLFRPSRKAGR